MKRDSTQTPYPVRFPRPLARRLERASKAFGLNLSELIRRSVDYALEDWEKAGHIVIRRADGKMKG